MADIQILLGVGIGSIAGLIGAQLLCYAPKWAAVYFAVFAIILYFVNEMLT